MLWVEWLVKMFIPWAVAGTHLSELPCVSLNLFTVLPSVYKFPLAGQVSLCKISQHWLISTVKVRSIAKSGVFTNGPGRQRLTRTERKSGR